MEQKISENWVVEGFDSLREAYKLGSDAELAKFLGTSPAMINQVRGGRTRPSAKLKFTLADKLGYLGTVEGLALVAEKLLGEEVGKGMKEKILGLVNTK